MSLKINLTSKEAESKALDPLPRGEYHVKLTDIDERECGPSSKNPGKPYWAIEFTVQDGDYENRKVWTNCMLFDGALYTLVQLLKATGYDPSAGEFEVPDQSEFLTKDYVVRVQLKPATDEYDARNEVKSIKAYNNKAPQGSASTLLP